MGTQIKLYKIRQRFDLPRLENVQTAIDRQFSEINLASQIQPGAQIGVTVGSRGISNIVEIIRCIVDWLKLHDACPFIIPAMGSHGGATAEGQTALLSHYGITEESMQCPIRSSMETVCFGCAGNGCPVYMDRIASECDGILIVNRIKPHTDFSAENESGLIKMVSIGLGNADGATAVHGHGLAASIPQVFEEAAKHMPFLAGLAILENAAHETAFLKAVPVSDFLQTDAELLRQAISLVPRLPSDQMDILIVKEMGKCYSGTGMDTKVIGRIKVHGVPEPVSPDIDKLVVLRLAPSSDGNALGVGLADITTKALVDSIDRDVMYSNLIPTTYLERGKIPIYTETEENAIDLAFRTIGAITPERARVCVIENTLEIATLWVSAAILETLNPNSYELIAESGLLYAEDGSLIL